MGLLSWLSGGSPKIVDLVPAAGFAMEIVGESYCQRDLSRICGGKTHEGHEKQVHAVLIPEDKNPHDADAVRVEVDGLKVGYLSRSDASAFRTKMATEGHDGASGRCSAIILGGWDRGRGDQGDFGVRLKLTLRRGKLVK